jgi:hypothetical protein
MIYEDNIDLKDTKNQQKINSKDDVMKTIKSSIFKLLDRITAIKS